MSKDHTGFPGGILSIESLREQHSAATVAEPSALPAGWHINVELRKPEGGAQSMLHVVAPNGAGHITYYAKSECNEALLSALHAAMQAAQQQAEPRAKWEDPRVQQVYEILCRDDAPPAGEHWEGFQARIIVDALFGQQAAVAEKSDFATFYVPLGRHSGREGLIGKHGIDRDFVRQALYLGAPAVEIYEGRRHVFISVAAFEAWMRDHAAAQQEATK